LHDELQFAGGELPNQVLHSGAANSQSQPQLQSSAYSQCGAKHGVPDGLYLDPTGVPERMRAELPLSLSNRQLHRFNQRLIICVCLRAIALRRGPTVLDDVVHGIVSGRSLLARTRSHSMTSRPRYWVLGNPIPIDRLAPAMGYEQAVTVRKILTGAPEFLGEVTGVPIL